MSHTECSKCATWARYQGEIHYVCTCGELARLTMEEIYKIERDEAIHKLNNMIQHLLRIHALLYPPMQEVAGKTYTFRPSSIDPHEVLQELSDRIRAIPDEMEKIKHGRP